MMNTGRRSVYVLLLAALLALGIAGVARADTFAVNSFSDDDNVAQCQAHGADCTLRGAIDAANAASSDDIVTVPTGRYDFGSSSSELVAVPNGSLTIQGATGDAKDVIVSAEGVDRVLLIDPGTNVTIQGVTLQDGDTGSDGGGILMGCENNNLCIAGPSQATTQLTLDHSRVLKNTSGSCGGGIYGQAISTITLRSASVDRNSAGDCGGGIYYTGVGSTLSMFDSSVDGNSAADDQGGGIDAEADIPPTKVAGVLGGASPSTEILHAERSSVSHNQSTFGGGGGIYDTHCDCGGFDGDVTLIDSHVDNNFADFAGGGVAHYSNDLNTSGTTVSNNTSQFGSGGGVYANGGNVTFNDSHVDQNTAAEGSGGGVINFGGYLHLLRSSVDLNKAGPSLDTDFARGGGVYSAGESATKVGDGTQIIDSSISGNHSYNSGGGLWDRTGANVVNTTIANNLADTIQGDTHRGGGVFSHSGAMTLTNDTIAGNLVANGQGGGLWDEGQSDQLTNTIIADNEANMDPSTNDCGSNEFAPTSNGHNLDGTPNSGTPDQCGLTDGVNGDLGGRDARLGPLQDNGGPTLTRALLDGSPAIDNGDDSVCSTLTNAENSTPHDQRGVTRPFGAHCDIGAYEVGPPPANTPSQPAPVITPAQQVQGSKLVNCLPSPPRSSIARNALFLTHSFVKLEGRTIDFRCAGLNSAGGIKKVFVSVALRGSSNAAASSCQFLTGSGSLTSSRSCRRRVLLPAKLGKQRGGKVPFTFVERNLSLPSGNYVVEAFGIDSQNNKETKARRFNVKHFRLK